MLVSGERRACDALHKNVSHILKIALAKSRQMEYFLQIYPLVFCIADKSTDFSTRRATNEQAMRFASIGTGNTSNEPAASGLGGGRLLREGFMRPVEPKAASRPATVCMYTRTLCRGRCALGPAPSTPFSTATGVYTAVGDGCGWTLGGRVDTDNHRDEERGDGGLSLGIVTMSARS